MSEREQVRIFNQWARDTIDQTSKESEESNSDMVANYMILFQYISTELQNQLSVKLTDHKDTINFLKELFEKCFETAIGSLSSKIENYDLVQDLKSQLQQRDHQLEKRNEEIKNLSE